MMYENDLEERTRQGRSDRAASASSRHAATGGPRPAPDPTAARTAARSRGRPAPISSTVISFQIAVASTSMRFAAPSLPTICAPSSRPAAPLDDDLHRDRRSRPGSSRPGVVDSIVAVDVRRTRRRVASRSLRPVRPTSYVADLRDRGADRRRRTSHRRRSRSRPRPRPCLLACVPSAIVTGLPRDAVEALDAVARGPHAARRSSPCRRVGRRCRRVAPISMPASRGERRLLGSTPSPSTTMSAGSDAVAGDDRGDAAVVVGLERR